MPPKPLSSSEESHFEKISKDTQKPELEVVSDSREKVEFKLKSGKPLTEKDLERFRLIRLAQAGDQKAMNEVVKGNVGLAISIANKYARFKNVDFDDLLNEGRMGIVEAVEKFDFAKGRKFSTYAIWWIRNRVSQANLEQGRTIKVPIVQLYKLNKIIKKKDKQEQELGRSLTGEEFEEQLKKSGLDREQIETVISLINMRMSSFDSSPTNEEQRGYETVLYSDAPSAEEQLIREDDKRSFRKIIRGIESEVHRVVLERRLFDEHTLKEIGHDLGLTRERVGQIEKEAKRKVRNMLLRQIKQRNE